MKVFTFKIGKHSTLDHEMVEVFNEDGRFVAGIYPGPPGTSSINIVSKYFTGKLDIDEEEEPPALSIGFQR